MLLDAGEGAQIRLNEVGFDVSKLDAIFITHLHGDHVFGLPPLLQSIDMRVNSMKMFKELTIGGPKGVQELVKLALGNIENKHDKLSIRLHVYGDVKHLVTVKESLVVALPLKHGSVRSWGIYVKSPVGRNSRFVRIFYGADGILEDYSLKFLKLNGVDVLIYESTYSEHEAIDAERTGHATSMYVAKLGRELGVEVVLMTHISQRYGMHAPHLEEARRVFRKVFVVNDLDVYPLHLLLKRAALSSSRHILLP